MREECRSLPIKESLGDVSSATCESSQKDKRQGTGHQGIIEKRPSLEGSRDYRPCKELDDDCPGPFPFVLDFSSDPFLVQQCRHEDFHCRFTILVIPEVLIVELARLND
jgi:hypothetical protein